jgi:hypothetical protein
VGIQYPQVSAASINAALTGSTLQAYNFTAGVGGWIGWSSGSVLRSPADATVSIRNFAETISASLVTEANHTLAQRGGTSAQTLRLYNTFTDASNYERFRVTWASNILKIGGEFAGTGVNRVLQLSSDGITTIELEGSTLTGSNIPITMYRNGTSAATILAVGSTNLTSTAVLFSRLIPTVNQASGTYTVLDINPTETAVGAGPHYLIRGRIGAGSDVFGVKNDGAIMSGNTSSGVQFKNNGGTEAAFTRADGTTAITLKAGLFRSTGGTLASLGTANGAGAGSIAYVSDLTATTRGSTASGGGSSKAVVWSDGTNWIVM